MIGRRNLLRWAESIETLRSQSSLSVLTVMMAVALYLVLAWIRPSLVRPMLDDLISVFVAGAQGSTATFFQKMSHDSGASNA